MASATATTAGTGWAIELTAVDKRFGARRVLDGVTLRVARGQRLGVIGPAAAGKSVLLKLIAGLLRPDAGTVRVTGRIGMLFQNSALFDFLDVAENVAFPLVHASDGDVPEGEIALRVAERLRAVGLAGSERKMPAELSGGMKKRAGLARATVGRPEIVLYDEPTAGLDPVTTAKVYELLRTDHDAGGGTAVVVSSDVEAVAAFADTIAFVDGGGVRWVGAAAGLLDAEDDAVRGFARGTL
jgi:phospholipid/cholesterol/gamma-HCH transport system ATP-binding protein